MKDNFKNQDTYLSQDSPPQPSNLKNIIPRDSRNLKDTGQKIPHIYITDSRDRNYDKYPFSYDYQVDVNPDYKFVTSVELISAEIPKSSYIINNNNNLMYFEEQTGTRIISTIPVGNYTITDLLTAIGTEMTNDSALGVTYTATLNTLTDKITITSDAFGPSLLNLLFYGGTENFINDTVRSIYLPNSIGPIIGYNRIDLTGSFSYEAQNIYDLSGDTYVLLHIFDFDNIERPDAPCDAPYAKIPLDVDQGQVKFYNHEENQENIKYFSPSMGKLSDLHIKFKNYNNDDYDFNGREHSMTFKITTKDETKRQF